MLQQLVDNILADDFIKTFIQNGSLSAAGSVRVLQSPSNFLQDPSFSYFSPAKNEDVFMVFDSAITPVQQEILTVSSKMYVVIDVDNVYDQGVVYNLLVSEQKTR